LLPRAASAPKCELQPESLRRPASPVLHTEGPLPRHRFAEPRQVADRQRLIDPRAPGGVLGRRFRSPELGVPGVPSREAGPFPVLGPRHELRPEWVALHLAEDGDQVRVVLDRERLESALPDAAGGPVVEVIALWRGS
jgi:hypothetical protein